MELSLNINKAIEKIVSSKQEHFSHNDILFLQRIYSQGIEKYKERLKAISFIDHNCVLDAGCGFGQWALALAEMNKNVVCCDIAQNRVDFLKNLINSLSIKNLSVSQNGIDKLPFENESFDIIFCYQVIQCTPWKKTLSEFKRVLKPGGKVYITTNDIGWYLYLWQVPHNKADDYDPKELAAMSFMQTLSYEKNNQITKNMNLIIEIPEIIAELEKIGFHNIQSSNEGNLKLNKNAKDPIPFFNQEFSEFTTVYEVLAHK